MAQDLSEKELLKMEVEQLKKEVTNPRAPVSLLFSSPLSSPSLSVPDGIWGMKEEVMEHVMVEHFQGARKKKKN